MKCIWISMLMISVLYLFVLYSYFASHAYVSANDSNLITLKSNFTSKNFTKRWIYHQDTVHCKSFEVENFCIVQNRTVSCWKTLSQLDLSLVYIAKAYSCCTGYFPGKVLQSPIDPRKPQNFFTVNDLQYTG